MGNTGSSEAEGPSNAGFTPLITLKRPGTINATRTPSQAGVAAEGAAGGATGDLLKNARAPEADSDEVGPSHAPAPDNTSAEKANEAPLNDAPLPSEEPAHRQAGASPAKPNGLVYGASYPPEMIEAMMQEYNAKHAASAGGGFWGGGRPRTTSLAASTPSTPSVSEPSTPASAEKWRGAGSGGVRDEAGGEVSGSARRGPCGSEAEKLGEDDGDGDTGAGAAGVVIGSGQSDGRAEAAAAAATVGGGGLAGTPSREEGAAPQARSSKDCRTIAKYEKVLSQQLVDLEQLQQLCWSGCPNYLRPSTWRLLLRYAPGNAERRDDKMNRLRSEYADAVANYFDKYDPARASAPDQATYNQIHVDLPRTNPAMSLFQVPEVQQSLHRVLYVWAIRHPGTGYVQGINDLVTPFFFVFLMEVTGADEESVASGKVMLEITAAQMRQVEADCYHCLTNMLDKAQDNYVHDSKGIQEKVFRLKRIIGRLDEKLVAHLEANDVEFLQFAFRWFNCLLMRELSMPCTLRLWDTYVADKSFASFHVYVCAAVLLHFSRQLQAMDFQEMIFFLQKMPTDEWQPEQMEVILAQAYSWCQQFSDSHV